MGCLKVAQIYTGSPLGSISASTVRRILQSHHLKPWRHHLWLSPKVPRDRAFAKSIREISRLYTRKLKRQEMVLRVDEKTSKQPRPRQAPTPRKNSDILTWPSFALMSRCSKVGWVKGQVKMSGFVVTLPAQPKLPVRVEHEYQRKGALNLFAAFDTRTGKVWGQTYERKRQEEFIAFLSYLDREIPPTVTLVHIVLDNLRMHKGKKVQAWLVKHPRFV